MSERLTESDIEMRLIEAVDTLWRLTRNERPDKPSARLTIWPPVVHEYFESYGHHRVALRPVPPSPAAIDRLDETMAWVVEALVDERERHLVWARANGVRWKLIAYQFGCDRSTAWRRWVLALTKLAAHASPRETAARRSIAVSGSAIREVNLEK